MCGKTALTTMHSCLLPIVKLVVRTHRCVQYGYLCAVCKCYYVMSVELYILMLVMPLLQDEQRGLVVSVLV